MRTGESKALDFATCFSEGILGDFGFGFRFQTRAGSCKGIVIIIIIIINFLLLLLLISLACSIVFFLIRQ